MTCCVTSGNSPHLSEPCICLSVGRGALLTQAVGEPVRQRVQSCLDAAPRPSPGRCGALPRRLTWASLTWPQRCGCSGDDTSKGSAEPGQYRLVLPLGKGIPLSDVKTTSVLFRRPASRSSWSTSPIPEGGRGPQLSQGRAGGTVPASAQGPCLSAPLWGHQPSLGTSMSPHTAANCTCWPLFSGVSCPPCGTEAGDRQHRKNSETALRLLASV